MSQLPDKQKVILFIDDEKICHTLVELIVPNFTEYKLVGAFSGKEAIMLAKRYVKELSLILSDIMLPDINGYEVYNTLRADSRFTNVPFVFQSGIEAQEQELNKLSSKVRHWMRRYHQLNLSASESTAEGADLETQEQDYVNDLQEMVAELSQKNHHCSTKPQADNMEIRLCAITTPHRTQYAKAQRGEVTCINRFISLFSTAPVNHSEHAIGYARS